MQCLGQRFGLKQMEKRYGLFTFPSSLALCRQFDESVINENAINAIKSLFSLALTRNDSTILKVYVSSWLYILERNCIHVSS